MNNCQIGTIKGTGTKSVPRCVKKCGDLLLAEAVRDLRLNAFNSSFTLQTSISGYLQDSSHQIKCHKGEGECGVACLKQVNGVKEHQMPWDH